MVPVVLVLILRGNKRNSLSTSVPTDTNQAYGVTKQNDMDKICNDEHIIYSYLEVVLNNEVITKRTRLFKKMKHILLQMLSQNQTKHQEILL